MALTLETVQQALSYAGPVLAAVLLLRLWHERLLGRYRFFAAYLFCLFAEVIVLLTVQQGTNRYIRVYIGVESAMWIAQILMILEMFSLVFRSYPGISGYWRKIVLFAFLVATLASLGFAMLNHQAGSGVYPWAEYYLFVSRVIAFTVLAFFMFLLAFLFWFPIALSRNVVIYTIGFSLYFGSRALIRLAGNLSEPGNWVLFSCISQAIVVACLIFWTVALTRRGEGVDVTVGHRWQPAEGVALIQQLESINAVLLRTARK